MPDMVVLVRAAGEPGSLAPSIKSISQSLDDTVLPEIRQLKQLYHDNVAQVELTAAAVSLVGLVAVSLAGIGILGLVAFAVTQRTKEIAIRIAVGARPLAVLGAVLRQFRWPVLLGLAAGTILAAFSSHLLRAALYGVDNLDPLSYAGAVATLTFIVCVAMLIPATRTLRLDLAKILHYE
jgi:ABC-type antimicrobial peptide transport system permease subunit